MPLFWMTINSSLLNSNCYIRWWEGRVEDFLASKSLASLWNSFLFRKTLSDGSTNTNNSFPLEKCHLFGCYFGNNLEKSKYRWTWIWQTTVRRIFAYEGRYARSQSDAYQVFVICIRQILHMTDQFSWSHWVCHIQVHLYSQNIWRKGFLWSLIEITFDVFERGIR